MFDYTAVNLPLYQYYLTVSEARRQLIPNHSVFAAFIDL